MPKLTPLLARSQNCSAGCLCDGLPLRLEKRYDLASWVRNMPLKEGLALGATFKAVEDALFEKARVAMRALASEADWRAWLTEHRAAFDSRADGFWAREGEAPLWRLLVGAADLLTGIHDVCQDLDRRATPRRMLGRYAQDWWRADHDFRRRVIHGHSQEPLG